VVIGRSPASRDDGDLGRSLSHIRAAASSTGLDSKGRSDFEAHLVGGRVILHRRSGAAGVEARRQRAPADVIVVDSVGRPVELVNFRGEPRGLLRLADRRLKDRVSLFGDSGTF
jgi:hypothetical protein